MTITLWEGITKSNHEDVIYYKRLFEEYTKDLLFVMREDFLEEITGGTLSARHLSSSFCVCLVACYRKFLLAMIESDEDLFSLKQELKKERQ